MQYSLVRLHSRNRETSPTGARHWCRACRCPAGHAEEVESGRWVEEPAT